MDPLWVDLLIFPTQEILKCQKGARNFQKALQNGANCVIMYTSVAWRFLYGTKQSNGCMICLCRLQNGKTDVWIVLRMNGCSYRPFLDSFFRYDENKNPPRFPPATFLKGRQQSSMPGFSLFEKEGKMRGKPLIWLGFRDIAKHVAILFIIPEIVSESACWGSSPYSAAKQETTAS